MSEEFTESDIGDIQRRLAEKFIVGEETPHSSRFNTQPLTEDMLGDQEDSADMGEAEGGKIEVTRELFDEAEHLRLVIEANDNFLGGFESPTTNSGEALGAASAAASEIVQQQLARIVTEKKVALNQSQIEAIFLLGLRDIGGAILRRYPEHLQTSLSRITTLEEALEDAYEEEEPQLEAQIGNQQNRMIETLQTVKVLRGAPVFAHQRNEQMQARALWMFDDIVNSLKEGEHPSLPPEAKTLVQEWKHANIQKGGEMEFLQGKKQNVDFE